MTLIQPKMDRETIFIQAESLSIHVIGSGTNAHEILARLREEATLAAPVNNTVAVQEALPRRDFIFLLADMLPISATNIVALDEHLDGIVPVLTA